MRDDEIHTLKDTMDLRALFKRETYTFAVIMLIAGNLVPLIGAYIFGWNPASILVLYWMETVIIGILNIPKIFSTKDSLPGKIFIAVFFTIHFGGFCAGHAVFLASLFGVKDIIKSLSEFGPLFWTGLTFAVIHIVSMVTNFYGKGEYKTREANTQMFMPYGRVIILHVVIILSGFLTFIFGGMAGVVILVVIKIIADIGAHMASHAINKKSEDTRLAND